MKPTFTLTLLFVIAFAAPAAAGDICAQAEATPDGKIAVEDSADAHGVQGMRGCAYVQATTDAAYAVLTDYESFPRWIDKVDKIHVAWTDPATALVDYELGTFFGTYKYRLKRVHRKPTHVEWQRVSGDFKTVSGTYDFRPAPGGGAWVLIENYVDPGVKIPAFIEDYFRKKASRRLLEDIREEVARRQKK